MLCTVCRDHLPLTEYNFSEENSLDRTFYGRIEIAKASSFLFFHEVGIVKNLIHYLKYKNQPQIGIFLGNWYGSVLKEDPKLPELDMVIPVPMHPKKLKKRGYNQVEGFGRQIAMHLGVPYRDDILIKTTHTKTQTRKSRIYRWQHQQPIFAVPESSSLANKKVLLVDDVVTTGATLENSANAIKTMPGTVVYIATMAMVP